MNYFTSAFSLQYLQYLRLKLNWKGTVDLAIDFKILAVIEVELADDPQAW